MQQGGQKRGWGRGGSRILRLLGGLLFCRNKREEVSASKTDLLFFLKKVKFQKFYRVEKKKCYVQEVPSL